MKLVYTAGPYRAATAWQVEAHIRVAEDWAHVLLNEGLVPVIPHAMYRYFDGLKDDWYWLDATLELLRRCDAILLLPGWEGSEGTLGEIDEARRRGMPMFDTAHPFMNQLREWAASATDRNVSRSTRVLNDEPTEP